MNSRRAAGLVSITLVVSTGLAARSLAAQTQSGAVRGAAGGATAGAAFEVPAWAFPLPVPASAAPVDTVTQRHVPRSRVAFTDKQIHDQFNPPDWHPETHGPAPSVVAHGRKPAVIACGFCHLPDGGGRPENATLAGLPAAYIIRQVADMKARRRNIAWTGPFRPAELMRAIADSATDAEIAQAARYFSRLHPRQRARVVEAANIPRMTPSLGLYFPAESGGVEPLGRRLIEGPAEPWRHEARDAATEYVAYVPIGSIARGRKLATQAIGSTGKSCTTCHGPRLRGVAEVPPLAGRSPSYILRQLLAFRTGARSTTVSAPMREIAGALSLDDMIAAAAYAGTRTP